MGQVIKLFDRDKYFTTKGGTTVNISELMRIHRAVFDQIRPGMTEEEIDRIIKITVAKMRPN
jgi:hypothetical protein